MTQASEASDWVDQYRGELEKQCSTRAVQVESLLFAGDFDAIHEWLNQWQQEDEGHNSQSSRYRRALSEYRQARFRARLESYAKTLNKLTSRASADSLDRSSASSLPTTDTNRIN